MGNAELAITLLLGLLDRAQAIGTLINQARAEKRDITDAELDKLTSDDDQARARLKAAIDAAR
jgi:hypothetical protein